MYNKQYVNTKKTKIRWFFFASREHEKADEFFSSAKIFLSFKSELSLALEPSQLLQVTIVKFAFE